MLPFLLSIIGGYLIGQSRKDQKFADGGDVFDLSKVTNVKIGKSSGDDAYILSANYHSKPMTDNELDMLQSKYPEFVMEEIEKEKISEISYKMDTQMAGGGRVKTIKESDIQVGKKFQLENGEVIEIKRLFKGNIDEDWVEFTRSSQSGTKEGSVNQLKIFINNWRPKMADGGMAKGGDTSFGDEYWIIVKTPKGLVTKKDFYGMGRNKKEIIDWCEERGWKYNEKGEKLGGQVLEEYEFFVKDPRIKPTKYDIQLPKMAKGGGTENYRSLLKKFEAEKPSILIYMISSDVAEDFMLNKFDRTIKWDSLSDKEKTEYNQSYRSNKNNFENHLVKQFLNKYFSDSYIREKCKGNNHKTIDAIKSVMVSIAKEYSENKYAEGGMASGGGKTAKRARIATTLSKGGSINNEELIKKALEKNKFNYTSNGSTIEYQAEASTIVEGVEVIFVYRAGVDEYSYDSGGSEYYSVQEIFIDGVEYEGKVALMSRKTTFLNDDEKKKIKKIYSELAEMQDN